MRDEDDDEFAKVSNRLPPRPRLMFGNLSLIPVTDYAGYVVRDQWCVPGYWGRDNPLARASTLALRRMGQARGIKVRVLV